MAFLLAYSFTVCTFPKRKNHKKSPKVHRFCRFAVQCEVDKDNSNLGIVRRSGNYKPSIWDFDFVQSLSNKYVINKIQGDEYSKRRSILKKEVRLMFNKLASNIDQLELIDTLQRLGLAYHFQEELKTILMSIYFNDKPIEQDLYATALQFRLLREHGFNVSSEETFSVLQDEAGYFRTSLIDDYNGLLSLYEASFLQEEDDSLLESARDFARNHLTKFVAQNQDTYLSKLIDHALELPLHWRPLRLECRWFIDVYKTKQGMNPILLELAKLDFNNVQAIHQLDLQHVSRWWKNTCLGEKLSFARDRIMECFLWTIGVIYEPQFGYCRRMSAKVNALITVIDDVYDLYGTLEELELFTNAVERWDVNALDQLPYYMQICFLALYNTVNEIGYDLLKEQRLNIIPYLKNSWLGLCRAYLLEAKWYYSRYTPTLEEYIENARVSISAPVMLVHAMFLTKETITFESLEFLKQGYPKIIELSGMVLRLADDLGTSQDEMKKGDIPKSIQCYMNETGASEEKAREYIYYIIGETWKKINRERHVSSPFSKTLIEQAVNLARMAQCMYQYGDGHAGQHLESQHRVLSLIVRPIELDY